MSKKTLHKNKIQPLENIINNSTSLSYLPVVKDKTIQVNCFVIEDKHDGYYIRDTSTDKILAVLTTKGAALAFVKNRLRKGQAESTIKVLDYVIAKNQIDEIFYKNTIKKTQDKEKKFVTQTRLHIARQDIHMARQELHGIIFDFEINNFNIT